MLQPPTSGDPAGLIYLSPVRTSLLRWIEGIQVEGGEIKSGDIGLTVDKDLLIIFYPVGEPERWSPAIPGHRPEPIYKGVDVSIPGD